MSCDTQSQNGLSASRVLLSAEFYCQCAVIASDSDMPTSIHSALFSSGSKVWKQDSRKITGSCSKLARSSQPEETALFSRVSSGESSVPVSPQSRRQLTLQWFALCTRVCIGRLRSSSTESRRYFRESPALRRKTCDEGAPDTVNVISCPCILTGFFSKSKDA